MRAEKIAARGWAPDVYVRAAGPKRKQVSMLRARKESIAACMHECAPARTVWDHAALFRCIKGRPAKPRVIQVLGKRSALRIGVARTAMEESCQIRHIPVEVFSVNCRVPAVVQARYEVWRDMREQGIGYLLIEQVCNFTHANIVNAIQHFVPTFEILYPDQVSHEEGA